MVIFQTIVFSLILIFIFIWISYSLIRYREITKIYITNYDTSFKMIKGFEKDVSEYYLETTMDNREKVYCVKYFLNEFDVWSYILFNENRSKITYVPVAVVLK